MHVVYDLNLEVRVVSACLSIAVAGQVDGRGVRTVVGHV